MKLLEETPAFSNYVFRGQSTHMIKDLVEIIEQKVDKAQVAQEGMFQKLFRSDEEKNMQNMLQNYVIRDLHKGVLKDLGIQAKEFSVTLQYKPKKVDTLAASLSWNLYCA